MSCDHKKTLYGLNPDPKLNRVQISKADSVPKTWVRWNITYSYRYLYENILLHGSPVLAILVSSTGLYSPAYSLRIIINLQWAPQ